MNPAQMHTAASPQSAPRAYSEFVQGRIGSAEPELMLRK